MKIPKKYINEYFVTSFIIENWEEIISMIEGSINQWGVFGEQMIEELKKYELNYISLVKKENKEDEENEEE